MIPKFRAFDKVTESVFDVEYIDFNKQLVNLGGCRNRYFHEVEIMQSTGANDVNGREIYESDILFEEHLEDLGVVVYDDEHAEWRVVSETYTTSLYNWFGYPIRGNLYEDPELLGGAE